MAKNCIICGNPTETTAAYCKEHNRDMAMLQRFTSKPEKEQERIIDLDARNLKLRKKVFGINGLSSADAIRIIENRSSIS